MYCQSCKESYGLTILFHRMMSPFHKVSVTETFVRCTKKYNPIELLFYAYLSDDERADWLSKVDPYVNKIISSLKTFDLICYANLKHQESVNQEEKSCDKSSVSQDKRTMQDSSFGLRDGRRMR